MRVKIAVVQANFNPRSLPSVEKKLKKYIQAAAKKRCQVIIFPEYFASVSETDDKAMVKLVQALAKEHAIDIVPGSFVEKNNGREFNTAYYIDFRGKILGRYRKNFLWASEHETFSAGTRTDVIKTRYGKIGLAICWDMAFPEVFRSMAKRGAQIIFCPTLWSREDAGVGLKYNRDADVEFVNACAIARAMENECFVVVCNAAGTMKKGRGVAHLLGLSQVAAPFYGAMKRLDHNREAMFVQELDTRLLDDAERAYRIKRDLKK